MAVPMGMAVAYCSTTRFGVRGLSETPIMESNIPRDSSSMSSSKPAGMDESSAKAPSSSMPTLGAMRRPAGPSGMMRLGRPSKRLVDCPAAPTRVWAAEPMMDWDSAPSR